MNNRTHKTCTKCGVKKAKVEFNHCNGWYKNKCRLCEQAQANERRREKRRAANTPMELPKVRHPWELLGLECRPDWSKL